MATERSVEMKSHKRQNGDTRERVALVTGGTGGIGAAVAKRLAREGDRVIIVGRSESRAKTVLTAMREAGPKAKHLFIAADLSLLSETARVADTLLKLTDRLDAAIFCAAILSTVPEWTSEGLERNFVLNYLSRYLLARRLVPLLSQAESGRLVFVSNAGMYKDTLDFDDLQYRRGEPGLKVAGRTQFANDLLAVELADRLRGTGIAVSCVFPGFVKTDVFANARGLPFWFPLIKPLLEFRALSPEAAAETPVFLARSSKAAEFSGRFFGPGPNERPVPERARRQDRRTGLWNASEALVRQYLPEQGRMQDAASPDVAFSASIGRREWVQ
jgi:NAD(P)-dependent dehydrogenase (short-subunit alcohol dehydrogenase family)